MTGDGPDEAGGAASRIGLVADVDEGLDLFVLYDHPADHPDHVVIRAWVIVPGRLAPELGPAWLLPDVEAARAFLAPLGLHRIPRSEGDDAVVVETWM